MHILVNNIYIYMHVYIYIYAFYLVGPSAFNSSVSLRGLLQMLKLRDLSSTYNRSRPHVVSFLHQPFPTFEIYRTLVIFIEAMYDMNYPHNIFLVKLYAARTANTSRGTFVL
jgi:hypothetical protein